MKLRDWEKETPISWPNLLLNLLHSNIIKHKTSKRKKENYMEMMIKYSFTSSRDWLNVINEHPEDNSSSSLYLDTVFYYEIILQHNYYEDLFLTGKANSSQTPPTFTLPVDLLNHSTLIPVCTPNSETRDNMRWDSCFSCSNWCLSSARKLTKSLALNHLLLSDSKQKRERERKMENPNKEEQNESQSKEYMFASLTGCKLYPK